LAFIEGRRPELEKPDEVFQIAQLSSEQQSILKDDHRVSEGPLLLKSAHLAAFNSIVPRIRLIRKPGVAMNTATSILTISRDGTLRPTRTIIVARTDYTVSPALNIKTRRAEPIW